MTKKTARSSRKRSLQRRKSRQGQTPRYEMKEMNGVKIPFCANRAASRLESHNRRKVASQSTRDISANKRKGALVTARRVLRAMRKATRKAMKRAA